LLSHFSWLVNNILLFNIILKRFLRLWDWPWVWVDLLTNLVPHSQCSLRENPKFLQNFRSKNNTLKEKIWLEFLFNVCHYNSGLSFKIKNYYINSQNCMYFIKENCQNLRLKRKWGLWMRHPTFSQLSHRCRLFLENLCYIWKRI
jgi:hypothetical protein